MSERLGLIVADSSPLITLGAADALDCLLIPGVPVFIPYMVCTEVTHDMARLGAGEVATWLRHKTATDPELRAMLLFEDSDVRRRQFVLLLPERVTAISTGDFLHEPEAAGRIQSADHILDEAAARGRNIEQQRQPAATEAARTALRGQLTRRPQEPDPT